MPNSIATPLYVGVLLLLKARIVIACELAHYSKKPDW